ncbi:MAG: Fe-S cluster assembly ATPase SufC [Candidatus Omnitrophota bacterium]
MSILDIQNLYTQIDDRAILKGINLTVNAGEVHAIMGPNGSGKSTLAQVIAGREGHTITSGRILYKGKNLLEWPPEIRAREGIFVAFQYPVEIPGVNNGYFLRSALNAIRRYKGLEEIDAFDFSTLIGNQMNLLGMNSGMLDRSVNEGFSGGEKKRNEILQMSLLNPELAVLDETDSGLDIDALRIVSDGVNRFRAPDKAIVLITHYQRLLNYVRPDFVHVLSDGRIIKSGGSNLAFELEEKGYDWLREPQDIKK